MKCSLTLFIGSCIGGKGGVCGEAAEDAFDHAALLVAHDDVLGHAARQRLPP